GRIERDSRSGDPTGVMLEAGAKLAWNRVPQPMGEERERMVREALADLASHGFAEVHDLVSQPWLGPWRARLVDAGVLPLRVVLYPLLRDLDEVVASARLWQREHIVLGGAKLFADGTLNSRTAWMLSEYVDPLPGMARG